MRKNHSQHRLLLILESLIYSSGQMFLGLLLHPYRSMQLLVKKQILLPFIFYPAFFTLILYFLLKVALFANLYDGCFLFRFSYQLLLFFCFYWQLALFYLWFRFNSAFAKFKTEK